MPVFIKLLPLLFRVGGVLLIFFAGWFAKATLVENAELKKLRAQLEASNTALIQYKNNVDKITEERNNLIEELDNENNPTCNDAVPSCIARGFEQLHRTR
jgi:hypothetical protein